jgi:hypothetical protein
MNIINVKRKKTTKYNTVKHHQSYGIQNWLVSKGIAVEPKHPNRVMSAKYKELLMAFCNTLENFDPSKIKGFHTYESYVQNNFNKFCSFAIKKHNDEISNTNNTDTDSIIF